MRGMIKEGGTPSVPGGAMLTKSKQEIYDSRYVVPENHRLKCIVCKSKFKPAHQRRWIQKYCSVKCRNRANYLERRLDVKIHSNVEYREYERHLKYIKLMKQIQKDGVEI